MEEDGQSCVRVSGDYMLRVRAWVCVCLRAPRKECGCGSVFPDARRVGRETAAGVVGIEAHRHDTLRPNSGIVVAALLLLLFP